MYPEVTVTIGRSYWRCLTCRTFSRRGASIDQHVNLKHAELHPATDSDRSFTSKLPSHEADSYSDSEIHNFCSHKQTGFADRTDLSVSKPAGFNPFSPIAPSTHLSGGYHRVKGVKKGEVHHGFKDNVSETSSEHFADCISQFPSTTSKKLADENQSMQSKQAHHLHVQCLKSVKQKKHAEKTYSQASKKKSKNMPVHPRDSVDEQFSKTHYRRLRSQCKQEIVLATDESMSNVLAKECLQRDTLTVPASEVMQIANISFALDTKRKKTDGSVRNSHTLVPYNDNISQLVPCSPNAPSSQLSGGRTGDKWAKLENNESKTFDFKSVAGRKKQTSVSVSPKRKVDTGTSMNSDSESIKRPRPGRKAAKRRDLSKSEKEMMKQRYLQNVDIKGFIQHSERVSDDPQHSVGADEQTNDTSTTQINQETDSIMQDLQFLNTIGSPASQDFNSLTAENVEANAEISSTDVQTCSELVPSASAFGVPEHNLHTDLMNPFNLAAPATQQHGEHSEAKWFNHSQVIDDSSDLHTAQRLFLADAGTLPSAAENKQVPRDIVTEDAVVTQSLSTLEPFAQEFQHSDRTFEVGITEADTLLFVDKLTGPTNVTFRNVKPVTPRKCARHTHTFGCKICQAKYSTSENLSMHENKMSSFGVTQCKTCSKLFHGVHYLNLHVFGEHELAKQCICFECDGIFNSMEQLEKHLYSHIQRQECSLTQMRFHDCRICGKEILSGYAVMQSHYYTRHKAYLCFDCYLRSGVIYSMDPIAAKEHRQAHGNVCNICSKHFPSTEQLLTHSFQHVNSGTEDGTGMVCEKCGQWCANSMVVLLHDRWHRLQQVREKRAKDAKAGFACLQCDKVYRSKRNLDRHTAHSHSKSRTYKFHCEFCGKGVDSKNFLQDHIALHHLGVKRYACQHCDLRFVCRPTLKRHVLREHAKDRQYRCEYCGECFCEKIKLERHMFVHTGQARFMCEHCGKGFHTSSEFKNHMSVHAETRDFVCQSCGQDYKRKEHLRRHLNNCKKS